MSTSLTIVADDQFSSVVRPLIDRLYEAGIPGRVQRPMPPPMYVGYSVCEFEDKVKSW